MTTSNHPARGPRTFLPGALALLFAVACGGAVSPGAQVAELTVTIAGGAAQVAPGAVHRFAAQVDGASDGRVAWATTGGLIAQDGTYTAPWIAGTYAVSASSIADPRAWTSVSVVVAALTSVGTDAGSDAGSGSGVDAGTGTGGVDAGTGSGVDAGTGSGGTDAGSGSGVDAGSGSGGAGSGTDAGTSTGGTDAGTSHGGTDAGTSTGGTDAGTGTGATDAGTGTGSSDAGTDGGASPAPSGNAACRPDGLIPTAGLDVPYCTAYDTQGREKLANGLQRRVIGYFTSWRTGLNGQTRYLASDIPWSKLTHVNYAFAHVGADHRVSVGNAADPQNPATGLTWSDDPKAAMDPGLSYKGHFNLLRKLKAQSGVKVLVSIGGWAETGGYFDDAGNRVASGGFYSMAFNSDGSLNTAGIETFASSAAAFVLQYGFDGVDIDWEYASSMKDSGNPLDWSIANPLRGKLMQGFAAVLKALREHLDAAAVAEGRHYYLSVAAPASAYLLRGMETYQVTGYLDYLNVMSYDLHGAWNQFVGPNAALYDDGKDAELASWNVYSTSQYGGIGYLNTDWAFHYFRGSMPAGRINVGLPYYTRGWNQVSGGTNGLWGKSAQSSACGPGLTTCGTGATGLDNLWHDDDPATGKELGAGSNPLWHAKNLEKGLLGSYLGAYGLGAATLKGVYARNYDATLVAPWLWNQATATFLSTEDEVSVAAKADWVVQKGAGGVMIWELAGDFDWSAARNGGKGEYYVGSALTSLLASKFASATPYGNKRSALAVPATALAVTVEAINFPVGDSNYPINPTLHVVNHGAKALPGGSVLEFDLPTSAPAQVTTWSGETIQVVSVGHTGSNAGGLKGDFNRVAITLPSWKTLNQGDVWDISLVYYLPVSGPANYTVTVAGVRYALTQEQPGLPLAP